MSKFSKLGQVLKKGDAKHRIFIILIAVVAILFVVYLVSKFLSMHNQDVGNSSITNIPDVQAVQARKTSPAMRDALETHNAQRASQAKATGSSAIATIIHSDQPAEINTSSCSNCCNVCESGFTNGAISDLLASGEITQETADELNRLANANLSPEDYAAELDRLVREGKLTPEQARKLLAAYKKDHQSQIAKTGAKDLDPMIKDGQLSVDTANKLLDLQKKDLTPEEYAAELQRMVDAGELTPEQAAALLAKYKAQRAARLASETKGQLKGMEDTGQISPDVASTLKALQDNDVPVEDYAATLARLVKEGKLTPEQARRLLEQYKKQHGIAAGNSGVDAYANATELSSEDGAALKALQSQNASVADFAAKLQNLVKSNKISTETARRLMTQYQAESAAKQKLLDLLKQESSAGRVTASALAKLQQDANGNVSVESFTADLNSLSSQGQIASTSISSITTAYSTARQAAAKKDQLIEYFQSKKKLSADAAAALKQLQNQGASVASYADELQRLVDAGIISPDTAKTLLAAYRAKMAGQSADGSGQEIDFTSAAIDANYTRSGNADLDRIARAGAQQQAAAARQRSYTGASALPSKRQQMQTQGQYQTDTNTQVQSKVQLMQQQALKLYNNISPVSMKHFGGAAAAGQTVAAGTATSGGVGGSAQAAGGSDQSSSPPIIKAGAILYAVLDTAVNSDYPDSPVMATIVAGKYKGAKVLGKINTVQNGQRVMLTFTKLTESSWPTGLTINAYAIDPDTARTAVATDVNNHYMLRYGSLFASSFLQGLGQAISESGTTVSSDDGVVTSSTDDLNTEETILVALGTVGQNASGEVNKLVNTPPTVKVKAGVGIGILFMDDVSDSSSVTSSVASAAKALAQ